MSLAAQNITEVTDTIINALEEMKAHDILKINVQQISNFTDIMVIATGTSKRHIRSLANNIIKSCKEQRIYPLRVEGQHDTEWLLVDLGDIVVHVMSAASRNFYDLEGIWKISADAEVAS